MPDRYDISTSPQGQFQPGSNDRVLLNKLGITDPSEMDDAELALLDNLQSSLPDDIEPDQQLATSDLCEWHRKWLGSVYEWAGEFRTVNMEIDGFLFAAAHLIPLSRQNMRINSCKFSLLVRNITRHS